MPKPKRKNIEGNITQKLSHLKKDEILPMDHRIEHNKHCKKKISCEEWIEYHLRHKLYPDSVKFNRPSFDTVKAIWKLLFLDSLREFENYITESYNWLSEEEKEDLKTIRKQAIIIVLDTFVSVGQNQRIISCNSIFEALCRGYSDHFILGTAKLVKDMKRSTAFKCRRDLLLHGIDINKLWRLVMDSSEETGNGQINPLFSTKKLLFTGKAQYIRVSIKDTFKLKEFLSILEKDQQYFRAQFPCIKALFNRPKTEQEDERYLNLKICADIPYNEVKLGKKSKEILRRMEDVSLFLDVKAFKEDYEIAQKLENFLYEKIKKKYDIDPHLSNTKRQRWTREKAKGPMWSKREAHLFYRSVEEGLSLEQLSAFYSKADEELKKNKDKWQRKQDGFLNWQKGNKREGKRPSLKELVAVVITKIGWRQEVRERLNEYDRVRHHVLEFRYIYEQIKDKNNYLQIYTGYYRLINRRYQPMHFWPPFITSKHNLQKTEDELEFESRVENEIDEDEPGYIIRAEKELESYRKRWFKAQDPETRGICDLVGLDISSSQTQIIAKLLCIEDLETSTINESFKITMARMLWEKNNETTLLKMQQESIKKYNGPNDPRLQNLCKDLWMRISYGGSVKTAVDDQNSDPLTFGPGWKTYKAAGDFLEECLYKKYPAIKTFLEICHLVAEIAYKENPCAGVIFTDPSDGETVRWNPVARERVPISSGGFKLILSLPGVKNIKGEFKENEPVAEGNYKENYPVDLRQLKKMVAPCLVHMLDAYYSTVVMEKLIKRNITTFVAIHDCWLVPEKVFLNNQIRSGLEELRDILNEAAVEWYKGLESVYKELKNYLLKGKKLLLKEKSSTKISEKKRNEIEKKVDDINKYIEFINNSFKKWKMRVKNNYQALFRSVAE